MGICMLCKVIMISGTNYDGNNRRRYDECPKCHDRIYNKGKNFQEILHKEIENQKDNVPSKFGRRAGTLSCSATR